MTQKTKGYLLGIVAAASYGMNPLFALPLYADGMNPDSVLLLRYLAAIPMLAVMIKLRGRSLKVKKQELGSLVLFGVLISVSSLTLFSSYNHMAAGIASTLLFMYPIMVALIMALFFKEKISLAIALCIAVSIVGIGLLYKNGDGDTLSLWGSILVFISALTYAVYIAGINRGALQAMPTLKVTFYVLLFGIWLFAFRLMFFEPLTLPSRWYMWANVVALALFPTAISFLATTRAIQYVGATPTAILGALEPVTALFFGLLLFGETLSLREVFGLVLIILSVTFVVGGGRVGGYLVRLRKMFPRIRKR